MGGRGASSGGNKFDPLKVPNRLKEHYDKIKDMPIEKQREILKDSNDNFNKISNADKVYSKLQDYARKEGYKVREGTDIPGNGQTVFKKSGAPPEIIIKPSMSTEGKIKTLAHEIGHAKLHDPAKGYRPNKGIKELEAETVGHMFAGKHGIQTKDYSYTYTTGWMQKYGVPKSQIDTSFPKSYSIYNDMNKYVGEP
jgi:hypothetical protein